MAKEVLDKEVLDKEVFDKEVLDKEVLDKGVLDKEVFDKEVLDKEVLDKGETDKEVLDPPGGQVADPPNRQGFASNSPHSSACQQLSCSPPPFPAPPKMRPKPTCPIPNPCQHGRAFCSSPPQIFCPRPKPHVSPLVGLLASAQIWLVVIYNGRTPTGGEFPNGALDDRSLWEECSLVGAVFPVGGMLSHSCGTQRLVEWNVV